VVGSETFLEGARGEGWVVVISIACVFKKKFLRRLPCARPQVRKAERNALQDKNLSKIAQQPA
jgi:hypothetical protein